MGYRWKLARGTHLEVNSARDATFTLHGRPLTFYFTRQRHGVPFYLLLSGKYAHEHLGRTLSLMGTIRQVTRYAYDAVGNLLSRANANVYSSAYTYDAAGNLSQTAYPNGVRLTPSRDGMDRVTSLPVTSAPPASYGYTYGAVGNRLTATERSGRTASYGYDSIYRLTSENITGDPAAKNGLLSYALDPVGNRLSLTSTLPGLASQSFAYDANDRILGNTYDANGNTLVSGARAFVYDSQNRLKSFNGGAVMLLYDGDGNRVVKTAGGVTTQFLVDENNPTGLPQVAEELANGVVLRRYTYGLDPISQTLIVGGAGAPSYYGYDGLGSVRFLTDAAGAITDTYDYDAWGNLVNYTAVTPNSKLYRGEELDGDLGLYYLRARYFDPLTGRFLTTDPEQGSQHLYLYAGGDPVNRIDPTGRQDSGDQRGGAGLLIFDIRAGGYVAFAPAPLTWPVLRLSSCYLSLSMGGLPQDSEELIQRLEGCMAGGDKCGDSCRRPVYDPIPWNDPGTRSADRPVWGPRFTNNCYSYAINQPEQPRNERYKRQPGESSGRPVSDFGNCKAVKNAAMRDGLKTAHADDCCPQGYFRVKLFAGQSVHPPGFTGKAFPDYHWYRQDANCMWSSKHGLGPVDAQLKESEVQTDARSWGYNPCANMCAPIR